MIYKDFANVALVKLGRVVEWVFALIVGLNSVINCRLLKQELAHNIMAISGSQMQGR